jgi:hypothetical protein
MVFDAATELIPSMSASTLECSKQNSIIDHKHVISRAVASLSEVENQTLVIIGIDYIVLVEITRTTR